MTEPAAGDEAVSPVMLTVLVDGCATVKLVLALSAVIVNVPLNAEFVEPETVIA